jgi:predicted negative regulator of RcsB-dependent stress response
MFSLTETTKITMKLKTGWLALAFFVTVSTVGVASWYYQSHKVNSTQSASVQKAEKQEGFDVNGRVKVSVEK